MKNQISAILTLLRTNKWLSYTPDKENIIGYTNTRVSTEHCRYTYSIEFDSSNREMDIIFCLSIDGIESTVTKKMSYTSVNTITERYVSVESWLNMLLLTLRKQATDEITNKQVNISHIMF